MTDKNYIQYTSRIKSSTADGILLEADQIRDEAQGKLQSVINNEVKDQLASLGVQTTAIYRPKGSKATIAEVISLTDAKVGDVWNVESEFTLSGKKYPAGTNVACVTATSSSSHTDANWDALGGTVDLTPYAKNADLANKVDKVSGKGLSTNDYTTAEKEKLAGIETGAQKNTVTSVAGKTGAVTLAKADVGLGNVDNTFDINKPISKETQAALDLKANSADVYTKSETDTKLSIKANAADVYKKAETYSKSEVDTKIT